MLLCDTVLIVMVRPAIIYVWNSHIFLFFLRSLIIFSLLTVISGH